MKHIKPIPPLAERVIFTFWQNVDKTSSPNGCWLWIGAKNDKGYGIVSCSKNRKIGAHRISFHLAGGVTTAEKPLVCHGPCHNPSCVNPSHLEAGSSRKNIHDQVRDGTKLLGERANCAKLDTDKVREIRAKYSTGRIGSKKLGHEYNVDSSVILNLVHRRTWKHVDPEQDPMIPAEFHRDSVRGSKNPAAKITEDVVRKIRALRRQRWILREIAVETGISITNVHDIIMRKIWEHVDPDEPLPTPGQYHDARRK
jgi:hypothetical protein